MPACSGSAFCVGGFCGGSAASDPADGAPGGKVVEAFGAEGPAVPFAQFAVVWMGGIGERIEEAFEPG
jgi:hypothetical protein